MRWVMAASPFLTQHNGLALLAFTVLIHPFGVTFTVVLSVLRRPRMRCCPKSHRHNTGRVGPVV